VPTLLLRQGCRDTVPFGVAAHSGLPEARRWAPVRGVLRPCSGQPCQKQPSTNTTTCRPGGRCRECTPSPGGGVQPDAPTQCVDGLAKGNLRHLSVLRRPGQVPASRRAGPAGSRRPRMTALVVAVRGWPGSVMIDDLPGRQGVNLGNRVRTRDGRGMVRDLHEG
jgi:hypothetical protein